MKEKRNGGSALILCGLLLLGASLFLLFHNQKEADAAEAASSAVMEQLASEIHEKVLEESAPLHAAEDVALPEEIREMDTVEIDGLDYIGFLTVPELELELPVMSSWDYDRLKIAPCRFTGTLAGGDLVIAAHNYLRHFGRLMDLYPGAEILFTDVHGVSTRFTIAEMEILDPMAVEEMTASDYDLTLFTCTYGGATRYTVRYMKAE